MDNEHLIAIDIYCDQEGLSIEFVEELQHRGLISITQVERRWYVDTEHLAHLEKLARMHFDLKINLEGIEAICHLLERMDDLRAELRRTQERLSTFES